MNTNEKAQYEQLGKSEELAKEIGSITQKSHTPKCLKCTGFLSFMVTVGLVLFAMYTSAF